jgi:hypothetical protein
MTFARRAVTRTLLSGALLLTGGCSPTPGQAGQRVVFPVATGFSQGLRRSTPVDIIDVGVPALYNLTGKAVQVRKVTLVAVPAAVRLLDVTAHPGQATGIVAGNLRKLCRHSYPSYPVTAAVTRPHAESNWFLVLAVNFTRPGRYYLGKVKIYYTTGGQNGWQYQNLFTTILVQPAPPDARPLFGGCP